MIRVLDWFQLANNKENKTIQLRRYLHQYPELSFEEFQTHDYIVNQLSLMLVHAVESYYRYGFAMVLF